MFHTATLMEEGEALEIASRLSGWKTGQAKQPEATGAIKHNEEIVAGEDHANWPEVQRVYAALQGHGGAMQTMLATQMTAPKFNRYDPGDTYRRHYDASPMNGLRTDFACTVALTDPDDYVGGDLTIEVGGTAIPAPRLRPGQAVIYECGMAHWVTPVTYGVRVSSVLWVQSAVKDPAKRRLLVRLTEVLAKKQTIEPFGDDYTTLTGIQTELARMWLSA
jgi:PKHD-type hydroxylase